MARSQSTTWIFLAETTANDVQQANAGYPLTDEAAQAVAAQFNSLLLARVEAAYPDADIETGQGNSLLVTSNGDEDEDMIVTTIDAIASRLWESDEVWGVVAACVYCSSDTQHAESESVPAVDDDEAWSASAADHATDCEWIATRAHRLEA